jgi:histidyl-tRNA synthetase
LCDACRAHYDAVRSHLVDLGVEWEEAPRLVRGLDYYMRTTFEFVHDSLGAQSAVGGGGRYDGLSEEIGGPRLPGIGWALGIERTRMAAEAEGVTTPAQQRCTVFVVPLGAEAKRRGLLLVTELRRRGVSADIAYGDRGLKGSMKAADRSGAPVALVLGERDIADGVVQRKDLASGEQSPLPLDTAVATLAKEFGPQ